MFKKLVFILVLAVCLSAVAFGRPEDPPKQESQKKVVVINKSKGTGDGFMGLKDGESKTITAGGKTIEITRQGDALTVKIDGKEIGPDDLKIFSESGSAVEIEGQPAKYFVYTTGGDGKECKVHVCGDSQEVKDSMVFVTGGATDGKECKVHVTTAHATDGKECKVVLNGNNQDMKEITLVVKKDQAEGDESSVHIHGLEPFDETILENMADGETKTVEKDGHVLTITREGDTYTIKITSAKETAPIK